MSGASERANGRASGPVLTSLFLINPDHSATRLEHPDPRPNFSRSLEAPQAERPILTHPMSPPLTGQATDHVIRFPGRFGAGRRDDDDDNDQQQSQLGRPSQLSQLAQGQKGQWACSVSNGDHREASTHYGTKPGHFETLKIHFPTSEGVSEVSERANE